MTEGINIIGINKYIMLEFILRALKIYIPLLLGAVYVLGYERKKLDNLLKFFVINVHLCLIQSLLEFSFSR